MTDARIALALLVVLKALQSLSSSDRAIFFNHMQRIADAPEDIADNAAVVEAAAHHREHLTVQQFMADVGIPLQREIIGFADRRVDLAGGRNHRKPHGLECRLG